MLQRANRLPQILIQLINISPQYANLITAIYRIMCVLFQPLHGRGHRRHLANRPRHKTAVDVGKHERHQQRAEHSIWQYVQGGKLGLSDGCHVSQQLDGDRLALAIRHTALPQNHRARINRLAISDFHHASIDRFAAIGHDVDRLKTLKILVAPINRQRDIDIFHLSELLAETTHLLSRFAA